MEWAAQGNPNQKAIARLIFKISRAIAIMRSVFPS
jgi:hypothetical protein